MKTSWLNGSKRILSALLIAAALMFGWTPLGEGRHWRRRIRGNSSHRRRCCSKRMKKHLDWRFTGRITRCSPTLVRGVRCLCPSSRISVAFQRALFPIGLTLAHFALKRVRRMPTVSTRLSIQVNIHIRVRAVIRYRITSNSIITMQKTVAMCRKWGTLQSGINTGIARHQRK